MRVILAGCVMSLCLATAAIAQVRDRPETSSARPSDAASIAAGWTAAAAGRVDAAVKEADGILRRRPWDRAALGLKISALAAAGPTRALDAYEQWVAGGRADDAGLLEPVAIAVLNEIANGRAELKRPALRALAAARVPGAQVSLDALVHPSESRIERDAATARSGDAAALQRLNSDASAPGGDTPAMAKALAGAGPAGEPGLIALLKSQNPQTRSTAAEALGEINSDRAKGALKGLAQDPDPVVRMSAVISLAQLEDSQAMTTVERMLGGNVPDVQLAAARAWKGKSGPWVPVVRALLDNPDGLTRIEAARAIAPVDPEAARRVIEAALGDPNPVIRYESATAIADELDAQFTGVNLATLRKRLRDRDEAVRLAVATVLLRLARA